MSSLGGSSLSYTMTVSFFSVGRVIGGMSLGYLSHKTSVCVCVMVALVFGVVGNLLYFFALVFDDYKLDNGVFPTWGVVVAFLGRFIVGYGSTCGLLFLFLFFIFIFFFYFFYFFFFFFFSFNFIILNSPPQSLSSVS